MKDGTIYTASGISAGMDMALGFVADKAGYEAARAISLTMEYEWHEESGYDPFSDRYPE